jgi:hypothetical protein
MLSRGWTRELIALYTARMKNIGAVAFLLSLFSGAAWAQGQIISQIVDGKVWQTTIVLTNTTAATANASLTFFSETGSNYATVPWNLTFAEVPSTAAISLAAGETLLLHSPSVAPTLTEGWGLMIADPGVVAYGIFTKRPQGLPAQVGTSQAVASASRILVPSTILPATLRRWRSRM